MNFNDEDSRVRIQAAVIQIVREAGVSIDRRKKRRCADDAGYWYGQSLEALSNDDSKLHNVVINGERRRVPKLLVFLAEKIKAMSNLETQGLFRVGGQKGRMKNIEDHMNATGQLIATEVVHDYTQIFKRFLHQLTPRLLNDVYTSLLEAQQLQSKVNDPSELEFAKLQSRRLTVLLCLLLPKENLDTLLFCLQLMNQVKRKSAQNEMTESNLAIVFGPALLSNVDETPEQSVTLQGAVVDLIEQYRLVGVVPDDVKRRAQALSLEEARSICQVLTKSQKRSSMSRIMGGLIRTRSRTSSASGPALTASTGTKELSVTGGQTTALSQPLFKRDAAGGAQTRPLRHAASAPVDPRAAAKPAMSKAPIMDPRKAKQQATSALDASTVGGRRRAARDASRDSADDEAPTKRSKGDFDEIDSSYCDQTTLGNSTELRRRSSRRRLSAKLQKWRRSLGGSRKKKSYNTIEATKQFEKECNKSMRRTARSAKTASPSPGSARHQLLTWQEFVAHDAGERAGAKDSPSPSRMFDHLVIDSSKKKPSSTDQLQDDGFNGLSTSLIGSPRGSGSPRSKAAVPVHKHPRASPGRGQPRPRPRSASRASPSSLRVPNGSSATRPSPLRRVTSVDGARPRPGAVRSPRAGAQLKSPASTAASRMRREVNRHANASPVRASPRRTNSPRVQSVSSVKRKASSPLKRDASPAKVRKANETLAKDVTSLSRSNMRKAIRRPSHAPSTGEVGSSKTAPVSALYHGSKPPRLPLRQRQEGVDSSSPKRVASYRSEPVLEPPKMKLAANLTNSLSDDWIGGSNV